MERGVKRNSNTKPPTKTKTAEFEPPKSVKECKIEKLIKYCRELAELRQQSTDKTEALQEMARLARAGQKDSEEFKKLEQQHPVNQVIDYSDVIGNIIKTLKGL